LTVKETIGSIDRMESTSPTLEPIILNPVALEANFAPTEKRTRRWLRTFLTMFLGWFIGNLILATIIGLLVISAVGSTGLVNVPLLTKALFKPAEQGKIDEKTLASAQKKASDIDRLAKGQIISEMTFTESEINALLADAFQKNNTTITNPNLKISNSHFVFSGNLRETGAPVLVEGAINTAGGIFKLDFEKTVFGKINLPAQLTSSILNGALEQAGISLENTAIPARRLSISDGVVKLEDVTKQ
jgi:hypothetical protein